MTQKALSPLRRKDIETGRKLEREAIVAWLRERQAPMPCQSDSAVEQLGITADDIEAGEHLK